MSDDEAPETPRVPKEIVESLQECIGAFRECTAELRLTREAFASHQALVERRLDEIRQLQLRLEALTQSTDRGIKGLRDLIDQDYSALRDMILTLTSRVDGTAQLAASAYDLGESLTRKLRQAGVINGNETRRDAGSR